MCIFLFIEIFASSRCFGSVLQSSSWSLFQDFCLCSFNTFLRLWLWQILFTLYCLFGIFFSSVDVLSFLEILLKSDHVDYLGLFQCFPSVCVEDIQDFFVEFLAPWFNSTIVWMVRTLIFSWYLMLIKICNKWSIVHIYSLIVY